MVIECIGLSGSGKTELLELIEKELKRREVDYVNVSANLTEARDRLEIPKSNSGSADLS